MAGGAALGTRFLLGSTGDFRDPFDIVEVAATTVAALAIVSAELGAAGCVGISEPVAAPIVADAGGMGDGASRRATDEPAGGAAAVEASTEPAKCRLSAIVTNRTVATTAASTTKRSLVERARPVTRVLFQAVTEVPTIPSRSGGTEGDRSVVSVWGALASL